MIKIQINQVNVITLLNSLCEKQNKAKTNRLSLYFYLIEQKFCFQTHYYSQKAIYKMLQVATLHLKHVSLPV